MSQITLAEGAAAATPSSGKVTIYAKTDGKVYSKDDAGTETELGASSGGISDGDKGDVTVSSSGTVWTVDNDAISNAKLANMDTATIKGRTTAGTGDPEDLTATQATALLNAMVGDSGSGGTKGLVPAPAAGDAAAQKFLKADGTWAVASGSGSVATDSIWDAKGDLAVGTGANAASRLAAGTNGYVLTADSAEATGVKWASVSGGVSDGDKGDITVSSSSTVWTIDSGVITPAKLSTGAPSWDSSSNVIVSGDLTLSGAGKRITGDFSSATVANRVLFQTSTVNGASNVGIIPNGTSTTAAVSVYNNSDPTNSGQFQIAALSTDARINSAITGTGTYIPMTFYTGGSERMRIDTSGNVTVSTATGGLGYGTGAGGTVTQATSKSTAVTLNKPCGQITMNNAALAANTTVYFQLTNSVLTQSDVTVCSLASGAADPSAYLIWSKSQSGSAIICVRNMTGGSLSEAIVINFAVIKGATA